MSKINKQKIASWAKSHFKLLHSGYHGVDHWSRVFNNSKQINKLMSNKVNEDLLFLFAFFHDVERTNEGHDLIHGKEAAKLLEELNNSELFSLTENDLNELQGAMELHSNGVITGTILQKICYDSDRLDLWRADIKINPVYLCTDAAKQIHKERLNTDFYTRAKNGYVTRYS